MEESNQTTQAAGANTAPTQSAAAPNPQVMQPAPGGIEQSAKSNENKMMLWLILGLVVIILVVGGIYFYMSGQQKAQTQPTPTPAAKVEENLENELNALDVGDLDQEFSEVDKDLQGL